MGKLTKWDKRFMDLAKTIAEWSKDTNTKTGAIVVNDDNVVLSMGYNGFPREANDDDYPKRYEKPDKYFWTEHAERNSIYNAVRLGLSLDGCKMYSTYFPCSDCARGIIQSGIDTLYTEKPDFNHHKWGDSWIEAMIMFRECGVKVVWTNVQHNFNYCQEDIEGRSKCDEQCEHCKEYYKPLENKDE